MDHGYVYQGPRTKRAYLQRKALVEAGVAPGSILPDDRDADRSQLEFILADNSPMRPGTVLRIACEAYIGAPGWKRAQVLRRLAAMGVLVAVLDGEPVLYDTDAKIKAFNRRAAQVGMSDSGKAAAARMGAGPGRPTSWRMTAAEWRQGLVLWRSRAPWQDVAEHVRKASARHGATVSPAFATLRDTFGNRSDTSERPAPPQCLAEK